MSQLVLITMIYVVGGLVLAVLMFLSAAKVESAGKATGEALKLHLGAYEIDTSSVLVGLAIVAFAAMVGVPSYYLFLNSKFDDRAMAIAVNLSPLPSKVQITTDASGDFNSNPIIHVYRTRERQPFLLRAPGFDPVPVQVWFDFDRKLPMYSVRGDPAKPVSDFDDVSGAIPVALGTAAAAPPLVAQSKLVPAALHALPPPPKVQAEIAASSALGATPAPNAAPQP